MKTLLAVLSVCMLVCLRGAHSADDCATAKDKAYCDVKYCGFPSFSKDCPVICKSCSASGAAAGSCATATDKPYCDAKYCKFALISKECPIACKTCSGCKGSCKNKGIQDADCKCDCTGTGFIGEFCEISEANALVLDCFVKRNGVAVYRGGHNIGNAGFVCQSWSKTSPHNHRYTSDKSFQNTDGAFAETMEAAGNYCRDPSIGSRKPEGKPWCYNSVKGERPSWDYCDKFIKECV